MMFKITKFFKDNYPLFVVLILLTLAFHTWVFSFGYLTSGDWPFYFNSFLHSFLSTPQIWTAYWGFGSIDVAAAFDLFKVSYGVLSQFVDYDVSERILYCWPIILFTAFSTYFFLSDIFKNKITVLCGMVVFSFSTYYLLLSTGHLTLMIAYSLAPAIFLLFKKALLGKSYKFALLTSLVLFLSISYEPRATYITLWVLFFYYLFVLTTSMLKNFFLYSFTAIISVFPAILLSSYWLIPLSKSGSLVQNQLFQRALFGNEFLNILYAATAFHPFWTGTFPSVFIVQQIPLYFWLIPFISFFGLIVGKKNKDILFFGFVALLGILLTKQAGVPFLGLYQWMYLHFPGFDAYREASKFYFLISFGYCVLIASFVDWILTNSFFIRKGIFQHIVIAIIFFIFVWNIKPFILNQMGNLFIVRHIPSDYVTTEQFLGKQNNYFRTLWVPTSSRWSYFTNQHPVINLVDELNASWEFLVQKQLATGKYSEGELMKDMLATKYIQNIIDRSTIKYVFVPLVDSQNDDNFFPFYGKRKQFYISILNKLPYLHRISINTNQVIVYENYNYRPHLYITSEKETIKRNIPYTTVKYSFISPTEYKVFFEKISKPGYLNFSEQFDPDWKMKFGPFHWLSSVYSNSLLPNNYHSQSDISFNTYYIDPNYIKAHVSKKYYTVNKDGSMNIEAMLFYKPEVYLYIGLVISGVAGLIICGFLIYLIRK